MTIELRPYQQESVQAVREELAKGRQGVVMVAPTGAGKCLARGTPVLMRDGTIKPVEDVAVGDLLMGPDGQSRTVTSLARGREMMWRVVPRKGNAYVVNESHILSLRKSPDGEVLNVSVARFAAWPSVYRWLWKGWRVPGVLSGDLTPECCDISVHMVCVDDYFGFELAGPDRLFLLGDFTVTHNTVMFSHIAKGAVAKGKRILILAHRDLLIRQASRKLSEYGLRHGIIMAGITPDRFAPVQVASVQTLTRRLDTVPKIFQPDVIVIDETHLSGAKSYHDVVNAWSDARVLGVTGSPIRLDGKGLGRHVGGLFDSLVCRVTPRTLIDDGFLVQPRVFAPAEQIDVSNVKTSGGDYNMAELAAAANKPTITGSAVEHYRAICPGVPAIAFCVSIKHAEDVAAQFNASGIRAVTMSGETPDHERERILAALAARRIQVVTFCGVLVEGVDCPAIGCVILLRPTKSLSSYLQVIGRGLRPIYAQGYDLSTREGRFAAMKAGPKGLNCIVLDHAGSTFHHGLADAEREWTLDGREKKARGPRASDEVPLIQCPKCGTVHDAGVEVCHCGHVFGRRERSGPEQVDGKLAEITPEMAANLAKQRRAEVGRARSLEDLKKIAEQRGYNPRWAEMVFRSRQKKAGSGSYAG